MDLRQLHAGSAGYQHWQVGALEPEAFDEDLLLEGTVGLVAAAPGDRAAFPATRPGTASRVPPAGPAAAPVGAPDANLSASLSANRSANLSANLSARSAGRSADRLANRSADRSFREEAPVAVSVSSDAHVVAQRQAPARATSPARKQERSHTPERAFRSSEDARGALASVLQTHFAIGEQHLEERFEEVRRLEQETRAQEKAWQLHLQGQKKKQTHKVHQHGRGEAAQGRAAHAEQAGAGARHVLHAAQARLAALEQQAHRWLADNTQVAMWIGLGVGVALLGLAVFFFLKPGSQQAAGGAHGAPVVLQGIGNRKSPIRRMVSRMPTEAGKQGDKGALFRQKTTPTTPLKRLESKEKTQRSLTARFAAEPDETYDEEGHLEAPSPSSPSKAKPERQGTLSFGLFGKFDRAKRTLRAERCLTGGGAHEHDRSPSPPPPSAG